MTRAGRALVALTVAFALAGCGGGDDAGHADTALAADADTAPAEDVGPTALLPDATPEDGVVALMDPTRAGGLFAGPVPAAELWRDGHADVAAWPNPDGNDYVAGLLAMVRARDDGFPLTAGIFFPLSGAIDAGALPDVATSVTAASPVLLLAVDADAPDFGDLLPLTADFHADAGPFGAPNLLTLLPLQGRPLTANTRYAAVVRRRLGDTRGAWLGRGAVLADLLAGRPVAGLDAAARADYDDALRAVVMAGVPADDIAAITVFRTGDPAAELDAFVADARARALVPTPGPLTLAEAHDDFCVFTADLAFTTYQHGAPPYAGDFTAGGAWQRDADGAPEPFGQEPSRLVVTIPRGAAPAAGFPPMVFIRTGAGGDRPLVDRGVRDANGQVITPATGPGLELARAGWAGIMVDGPHGGPRNVSRGDEQFLMFNITNPWAMRDNVRESALELALMADVVAALRLDASACEGSGADVGFDMGHLAVMGHSMGGWLAPMVLAAEPRFRAAVLSGAGGSWIANVVYKQRPVPPKPFAEAVLGYDDREVHPHDPALTLLQWAVEAADPAVYAARANAHPGHVLMEQGIVDTYILPPIANTTSLSLGLDLAGDELDTRDDPRLAGMRPLGELLGLAGRAAIPLPASGNATGAGGEALTRIIVQHPEDGVEDGHEVIFQTAAPKREYRCFLAAFAAGDTPTVPAGDASAPCP
ncbi:MAG: hypothetical protein KC635_00175 [Myxococcales bacterium]|nr:hypothetical protein [Myxococcales bacterium]